MPESTVKDKEVVSITLEAIRASLSAGNLNGARSMAFKYLVANPGDVQAIFLAAQIEASERKFDQAVEFLDGIPVDHPNAGLPALGQSIDWLIAGQRFDQAETRLRRLLKIAPGAPVAHRRFAYLLNRQGRRQEASDLIRRLCLAGNVSQGELHTLIDQSAAVYDESTDASPNPDADPLSNFQPIGDAAKARILFTKGEFNDALRMLEKPFEQGQLKPDAIAFFGRLAMEVQDDDATNAWAKQITRKQSEFADHWVAMGTLLMNRGKDTEGAARSFCEALIRNPTDWGAMNRLGTCMKILGDDDSEQACKTQASLIRKSIFVNQRILGQKKPKLSDLNELAETLVSLERPAEALMWRAIAVNYGAGTQADISKLNSQRIQLLKSKGKGLNSPASGLAWLDRQKYALPKSLTPDDQIGSPEKKTHDLNVAASPVLIDIAQQSELDFQYLNSTQPKLRDLQIYEQSGGGVAALDFDLDGLVDLYFSQAGESPLKERTTGNALYRNLGRAFRNSIESESDERGYGQGVSSGDWNQDGFADLLVGNFGTNALLINNGDGTFRLSEQNEDWNQSQWTVSVAMADVTGDNLPDIIEANYIDDPAVHDITQRGANGRFVKFKGPQSYQAAANRIFVGRGDGESKVIEMDGLAGHSLGVVITDVDGKRGNEIFVTNDTDPNRLWFRQADQFVDRATPLGCAFSGQGGSSASMGVATADFNRDGHLDFHVSNFYNEPVHLYMQTESGSFADLVVRYDLYKPSMQALGFGTQALDFDNNGAIDLAVVNGHIDDMQFKGSPHRMRPQLFTGYLNRFEPHEPLADSYWSQPTIGRGLARLDWNADGKLDLIATHHDAPAALLENQTQTEYAWLQLQLIGTKSERDAIGAQVTIEFGDERMTDSVTTGDGFGCKNESILAFGLGTLKNIDSVTVRWPSGQVDRHEQIETNKRYLLVEAAADAFDLKLGR